MNIKNFDYFIFVFSTVRLKIYFQITFCLSKSVASALSVKL
jgi:hypothetical protein